MRGARCEPRSCCRRGRWELGVRSGIRENRLGGTVRSNGCPRPSKVCVPCVGCVADEDPQHPKPNTRSINGRPAPLSVSQRPSAAALSGGAQRRMIRNHGRGRKERLQISDVGDRAERVSGTKKQKIRRGIQSRLTRAVLSAQPGQSDRGFPGWREMWCRFGENMAGISPNWAPAGDGFIHELRGGGWGGQWGCKGGEGCWGVTMYVP